MTLGEAEREGLGRAMALVTANLRLRRGDLDADELAAAAAGGASPMELLDLQAQLVHVAGELVHVIAGLTGRDPLQAWQEQAAGIVARREQGGDAE